MQIVIQEEEIREMLESWLKSHGYTPKGDEGWWFPEVDEEADEIKIFIDVETK